MWIPILIILLVFSLAIGPVMWLRSTPRQSRMIEFRSRAAQLGLRVQLVPLSELGVTGESARMDTVAAYGLPWIQNAEDDIGLVRHHANRPWRLIKGRMSHEGHFSGWWDWQKDKQADKAWREPLLSLVAELPEDVVGIENSSQGLWVYWQEKGKPERVDQIASILHRLRQIGLELSAGP